MLKDIKWFYEKGNILEASKCSESAESTSSGFLDAGFTLLTTMSCDTEHTPTSGLGTPSFWSKAITVCCDHLGPPALRMGQTMWAVSSI